MNNSTSRNLTILSLLALALTASAWPPRSDVANLGVPAPGSYALPVIKAAADGEILDGKGESLRLSELTRGRVTVMSFIYTRCAAAKACPMATGVLLQLHRLSADDPALAKQLRLVSLSFDPENDTPARMAAYSRLAEVGKPAAEWHFVTTASQQKLQPILAAYGQAVDRKANPKDPTGPLNHTLRVFLIDRAGNIRNIYSSGTLDLQLVLADVKTLMLESAAEQPPLSPAQAAQRPGQVSTVAFPAETVVRVTDITDKTNSQPLEVLLTDARNDGRATATERASIIVRIPKASFGAFGTASMDTLARRFEGQGVIVTGQVEVEPHPFRHDANGESLPRPVLTITDPGQIRIASVPVLDQKPITINPVLLNP